MYKYPEKLEDLWKNSKSIIGKNSKGVSEESSE